ncbi:MAG TPA: hypothetical protein VNJ08_12255 [Bacteriovoracaceae bacterium]|nr:hypothetical protein [Bacteriovoracaceae bacterium]
MKWFIVLIFMKPFFTLACLPNEIHIREQWINASKKEDGTKVSSHTRSEHCREIKGHSYFQDSSSKKFRNFKGKFKAWDSPEKDQLNNELKKLPPWLRKYNIANFLRASTHEGNPTNPALTYPDSKTVILFDAFFNAPDKQYILLHEISHIATWDIDPNDLQNFFVSNGWIYKRGKSPQAPQKVLVPDSSYSPSEDFANSVEIYYSNPKRFKEFNPKSFLILEGIIKSKEKQ